MSETTEQKLNSYTALGKIWKIEPKLIKEAEENGTLDELQGKFSNDNSVLSLAEKTEFARNLKDNYLKELETTPNLPQNLYDKIKGGVLEKQERVLKNAYDYDGKYANFNELLDGIITAKSKQPNESKSADVEMIKDLRKQISTTGDVAQQNLTLRNTVTGFEDAKKVEIDSLISKYETDKRNNLIERNIKKIPFEYYDDKNMKVLAESGFKSAFNDKVEIKFNDELIPIYYDKTTGIRIDNGVGTAMKTADVFAKIVKEGNVTLKKVTGGADIQSSKGGVNVIRTMDDARKYIEDNKITDMDKQFEIFDKIPVKQ